MTHQTYAYHIVNPSPWPLIGALSALLIITSGLITWFHFTSTLLSLGLNNVLMMMRHHQRKHFPRPLYISCSKRTPIWNNLIISEVLFFTGFFWAFYHSSLTPTPELGGCWPPTGSRPLNPLEVTLLNTSVLRVSITWAHHSLIEGNCKHIL